MGEFNEGDTFTVKHPFVREIYYRTEDGQEEPTWKPGVRFEIYGPEDSEAVADAEGAQHLVIVSIHKPGRYPERIFYTRQWEDPAGAIFGNSCLRVKTTQAFRTLIRGYRHDYAVRDSKENADAA